jgi:hypothetical protein
MSLFQNLSNRIEKNKKLIKGIYFFSSPDTGGVYFFYNDTIIICQIRTCNLAALGIVLKQKD